MTLSPADRRKEEEEGNKASDFVLRSCNGSASFRACPVALRKTGQKETHFSKALTFGHSCAKWVFVLLFLGLSEAGTHLEAVSQHLYERKSQTETFETPTHSLNAIYLSA